MNITQISSSFFSPVSDFRDKHLLPIAMVAHSQNENSDNSQFSKLSSEFITREMGAFAQNQHSFYSLLPDFDNGTPKSRIWEKWSD